MVCALISTCKTSITWCTWFNHLILLRLLVSQRSVHSVGVLLPSLGIIMPLLSTAADRYSTVNTVSPRSTWC